MAYDENLADRVRAALGDEPGLSEQAMFGGLSFLVHGNMCCGVMGDGLLVRIPREEHDEAVNRPRVYPFKMTGRPMRGWVQVETEALRSDEDLTSWVDTGLRYARSLPPKEPKPAKKARTTKR